MKLDGGLDMYTFPTERYLIDKSPEGRKVRYLNKNGYEIEREIANRYFYEEQILTVKEICVGRSSSDVEFIELPNHQFNTVMFEDIE